MALQTLHTNWLKGNYQADREFLIKVPENESLWRLSEGLPLGTTKGLTPYFDSAANSIALGYGFDLRSNTPAYVSYFLQSVGITLTPAQMGQVLRGRIRGRKEAQRCQV